MNGEPGGAASSGQEARGEQTTAAHPSPEVTTAAHPPPGVGADDTAAPPPRAGAGEAAPGQVGKYRLLAELGRGGMGSVWRALDVELGRTVALKLLHDPARAQPEELERFRREALAVARLEHPGIVPVFDAGAHEGRPWIAMALVEGESLEAHLRRERPSPRRAAELVRQVALALEHAHARGVVHRDVKPGNVQLDREGRPHLLDFGLARSEAASAPLTATGMILGTPAYMAPEQVEGESARQGPRTDVYALGAVLYRALAGRPPFQATPVAALLRQVLEEEPVALRRLGATVHADLETIALRCLEKDPARRYPSAGALAEELRRFCDGEPIQARPPGWPRRLARAASRHRLPLVALGVGLLGLVVALQVRAWTRIDTTAEVLLERQRREARDREELRRLFDQAIAANPRHAGALVGRSEQRLAEGDAAGALEDAGRAVEVAPRWVLAWQARAAAHLRRGDVAAAQADLEACQRLAPDDPAVWALAGEARRAGDDLDGAVAAFSRALELNPVHLGALEGRARAREAQGDREGAARDWADCVLFAPHGAGADEARAALARLGR